MRSAAERGNDRHAPRMEASLSDVSILLDHVTLYTSTLSQILAVKYSPRSPSDKSKYSPKSPSDKSADRQISPIGAPARLSRSPLRARDRLARRALRAPHAHTSRSVTRTRVPTAPNSQSRFNRAKRPQNAPQATLLYSSGLVVVLLCKAPRSILKSSRGRMTVRMTMTCTSLPSLRAPPRPQRAHRSPLSDSTDPLAQPRARIPHAPWSALCALGCRRLSLQLSRARSG